MAPGLVIAGWDSATFDVVDPLVSGGRLPALAHILSSGFRSPLRSTWPPMTDCAWTSAFTGANPGAHGIFGSWYRAPGRYSYRYFSARDRRMPALWEMAPGVRFLVWNVPMTYPPAPIEGAMFTGYGAPPGAPLSKPESLHHELSRRWPLEDLLDRAPHGSLERFRDDLVRSLEVQAAAIVWAANRTGADCVVAVWPHVDRAQHFFWRFRGTNHALAEAVDEVYEAVDRATAALMEAWPDADVVVVSDHGAGPLHGDVDLFGHLVRAGRAARAPASSSLLARAAWTLPPRMRRAGRRIAPALARRAVAETLGGRLNALDWGATQAFVGVHGDLWLNLEGREQRGTVAPDRAAGVLAELEHDILQLTDQRSGDRVFAAALARDDIYSGPAVDLAPDAMLDSWSCGYRIAPGVPRDGGGVVVDPEPLAGVREAWSADHRPFGMFAARGPRIATGSAPELALYDVCPTALALLQSPVPEGLDGRVAIEALDTAWLAAHPVAAARRSDVRPGSEQYSEDEAEAVAAHLKDLGYIE